MVIFYCKYFLKYLDLFLFLDTFGSLTVFVLWVTNQLPEIQWRTLVFLQYQEVMDCYRYHAWLFWQPKISILIIILLLFICLSSSMFLDLISIVWLPYITFIIVIEHRRSYQACQWDWLSCDDQGNYCLSLFGCLFNWL